jgi:hypothetical protein
MRNELLRWAEEEKPIPDNDYNHGYWKALDALIDKINSIPLPSVEGYLEGKDITKEGQYVENGEYVHYDDALTALRALKEDCEDKLCENAYGWVLKCNELQAEVERLRDGWISVEDRLPKTFKNVLGISNKGKIVIACVDSSGIFDDYPLGGDSDFFTHWQELPNPPKK